MPPRRHRTLEEARHVLWTTPDDPQLSLRIVANWRRALALMPRTAVRPPRCRHGLGYEVLAGLARLP